MRNSYTYDFLQTFDIDDSMNGKILTKKEIEQEEYSRLEKYIEEKLLPRYMQYRIDIETNTYKSYMKFADIIKIGFSLPELKYVIEYLNQREIIITSRLSNSYFSNKFEIPKNRVACRTSFLELQKLKPLDEKYQETLFLKYKKTNDNAIKQELISGNMSLVFKIMSKLVILKQREDFYEDLFSYACFGLIEAIDAYNPNTNYKFSTLATKYILNSILSYLRKSNYVNPICENFLVAKGIVEEKFAITLEKDFSIFDDILYYMILNNQIREQDLNLIKKRLIYFLKKGYKTYQNFGELIDYNEIDDNLTTNETKEILREGLNLLDSKTAKIFRLRFGFDSEPKKIREIAQIMGSSVSCIQKRYNDGLNILREYYVKETNESLKRV